jgi:hypothetical protein
MKPQVQTPVPSKQTNKQTNTKTPGALCSTYSGTLKKGILSKVSTA